MSNYILGGVNIGRYIVVRIEKQGYVPIEEIVEEKINENMREDRRLHSLVCINESGPVLLAIFEKKEN